MYAGTRQTAQDAWDEVQRRLKEVEGRLSDYRADSESRMLCQQYRDGGNERWRPISHDLWSVLRVAKELSGRSHGAFDVTVGPLSRLWRRARQRQALPDASQVERARRSVGYELIRVDATQPLARCSRGGMRLDFGGIGKGFGVDAAMQVLARREIRSALVAIGGDVAASGPPPGRTSWRVQARPLGRQSRPLATWRVLHQGVSTSGAAEQFLAAGGASWSHLIDPRTGWALRDGWSVTVLADSGMYADAYASTLAVLGPEQGIDWLEREAPSAAALYSRREDGRICTRMTRNLQEFGELVPDP